MATYQFIVLTSAKPGTEKEFADWYDKRHLADVEAVPGIRSARRFPVVKVFGNGLPAWSSVAVYEIETDGDPADVVDEIHRRARAGEMPISDALDRSHTVQLIARDPGPETG